MIKENLIKKQILMLFAAVVVVSAAWNDPRPGLFLVGDSISIHYGPYLGKYLKDAVVFERKQDDGNVEKNLDVPAGANGGDSRMVLEYLRSKMKDANFRPHFLLLNCGLHDIKRNPATGNIQVSAKEYRINLEEIFMLVNNRNIKPIWVRTTPVVDSIHNGKQRAFHRYAADLLEYNRIADEVCAKYEVPVIDLFGFTEKLGTGQFIDHVHYNESTRQLQAAFIAGSVRSYIQCRRN